MPCMVRGYLDPHSLQTPFADLVVVVNDVICDSGRSCRTRIGLQGFEFLLPETTASQPLARVEILLVEPESTGTPRLRRIAAYQLPVK